jgi:dihydroorotase
VSAPDCIVRAARLNGRVVDLYVADGKVLEVRETGGISATNPDPAPAACTEIDATGLVLLPSLVDAHAHLREPGHEYKETIASGLDAAAHGGFGTVMAMANTAPVNDEAAITDFMLAQARRAAPHGPRLRPIGALTKGLQGRELAPMAELARAGCVAFSNDGAPVTDSGLFRRALEYSSDLGLRVIDHCEDPGLADGGVMHEGALSGRLGLKGQPSTAEAVQVARDVLLSLQLRIPVHVAHVSCRESVELIAWAKQRGAPVTAEVTPHHLVFDETAMRDYDADAKVNPPLRTADDREALRQALRDGTIDMLATDHAPHAAHEKEVPVDEAPFGVSGLDTALSLTWSLVADGVLDEAAFVRAWVSAPGAAFSLAVNAFKPGDPADFLLLDPAATWTVTPQAMRSKGKNTLCRGRTLPGVLRYHYLAGRPLVAPEPGPARGR